jgi:hypothetical protein
MSWISKNALSPLLPLWLQQLWRWLAHLWIAPDVLKRVQNNSYQ